MKDRLSLAEQLSPFRYFFTMQDMVKDGHISQEVHDRIQTMRDSHDMGMVKLGNIAAINLIYDLNETILDGKKPK